MDLIMHESYLYKSRNKNKNKTILSNWKADVAENTTRLFIYLFSLDSPIKSAVPQAAPVSNNTERA